MISEQCTKDTGIPSSLRIVLFKSDVHCSLKTTKNIRNLKISDI